MRIMKIEVNVSKRYFFSILGVLLIVLGGFAVYAAWDNSKTVWHSGNDVKVTIGGTDYSLQEAINNKALYQLSVSSDFNVTCTGSSSCTGVITLNKNDWTSCFLTAQYNPSNSPGQANDGCQIYSNSTGWYLKAWKQSDSKDWTCLAVCLK